MEKPIAVREDELAERPLKTMSILDLMKGVLDSGMNTETVGVMKELIAMRDREEERDAEKQYNAAFVKLQSETGKIEATRPVNNSDGTPRYMFAPFEDIMDKVQPLLDKHGFGISFDSEPVEGNRLLVTCTLCHVAGHSRSSRFAPRYTKPPGSSDAQGDMSTLSYAKRGALCSRLNIRIGGMDDDARVEADEDKCITPEQAIELKEWVEELKADKTKFLSVAGSPTFEGILESKYEMLVAMLRKREGAR